MKDNSSVVSYPLPQAGLFLLLTYLITWILWSPYYAGFLYPESWHAHPFFHFAGSLGPLIAAFLTLLIQRKPDTIKTLLHRIANLGYPIYYLLIAMGLPFVLLLISLVISYFVDQSPISLAGLGWSREIPELSGVAFALLNVFVIGLGEETGWRGYLLPHLKRSMSAMKASLVLSVFWAVWHWPLFFYPLGGFYHMDGFGIMGWLFSLLLGSILFTWLFNSSGSVLVCAVFHGTMDIVFTSAYANPHLATYNGMLITLLGFLVMNRLRNSSLSDPARMAD